jgi:hypothetical protein
MRRMIILKPSTPLLYLGQYWLIRRCFEEHDIKAVVSSFPEVPMIYVEIRDANAVGLRKIREMLPVGAEVRLQHHGVKIFVKKEDYEFHLHIKWN